MTTQPSLQFDGESNGARRIRRSAERFHADNPHVYIILRDLALEGVTAGRRKMGIAMLWEVMRWKIFLATTTEKKGRKLNNNHKAVYSRWLMEREPQLAGIFEIRELRA